MELGSGVTRSPLAGVWHAVTRVIQSKRVAIAVKRSAARDIEAFCVTGEKNKSARASKVDRHKEAQKAQKEFHLVFVPLCFFVAVLSRK
jgi:hypothetical protein